MIEKKLLIPVAILLILGVLTYYFFFKTDPKAAFLREVKQMIETVNQGDHQKVKKHLSPEFMMMVGDYGLNINQAIFMIRKQDIDGQYQYKFANCPIFEHKSYAEVEIYRSERGGSFNSPFLIPVPFIWTDNKWMVAGDFRGERTWQDPYY
ncbi:MAG: hypothetical protein AAF558_13200 [Verrucomicrobiota bacterium]